MATIEYMGMSTDAVELVNSAEFKAALEAHPNLRLVTVEQDDNGDDVYTDVSFPLKASDDNIAVLDRENEDYFMWVLLEENAHVHDPSPAFIAILGIMDAFAIKTYGERLYLSPDEEVLCDDPKVLAATYDFSIGDYLL